MKERLTRFLSWMQTLLHKLQQIRHRINDRMRNHHSPGLMAAVVTLGCAVLIVITLFIPPYLGVANDGTVSPVMAAAGLQMPDNAADAGYNSYFVRVYKNTFPTRGPVTIQVLLIRLAKAIDFYFTRDALFDIRFLALLYTIAYLPAVYLVMHAVLSRLQYFTETMVISAAGLLFFADISYTTYFSSLYPHPLLIIGLMYLVGAAMSLQKKSKHDPIWLLLMLLSVLLLSFTRKHCFLVGLWAAIFFILFLRVPDNHRATILLPIVSVLSLVIMFTSLLVMPPDFDTTSRIHSMTRGVLLQANNPEKALSEFDIDGSYALLADVSLYDGNPLTEEENGLLYENFLEQYSPAEIGLYYMRHPDAFLSMLDLGIKSSFNLRRDYCGNYEQSTGMPVRAQSVFWSMYNFYKIRSAPKTIGYLVALIAAYLLMAGKKMFNLRQLPERFHYVYLLVMLLITMIGISDITYIIIQSGDAQLTQYNAVMGVCMDLLLFFVLAEILYKLNILEKGKEAKTS